MNSKRSDSIVPRLAVPMLKTSPISHSICVVAGLLAILAIAAVPTHAEDPLRAIIAAPLTIATDVPQQGELHLEVAENAYSALSVPRAFKLAGFPLTPDLTVDLDVERFWIWGAGTKFVIGTDNGDVPTKAPSVVFLRGKVSGEPASRVFLSASPFGMKGMVRVGQAQYVLAPSGGRANAARGRMHTIFDRLFLNAGAPPVPFQCQPQLAPGQVEPIATDIPGMPEGAVSRVALVALDADFEFRELFSSVDDAALYVCELIAAVSTFYEADINMKLAASFVRIWDTAADPFDAANTEDQLPQFKNYWEANMGSVTRNVAHLLSGRALGGGLAYVNHMCNDSHSYAVSADLDGSYPVPLQNGNSGNWDLVVVAHELGHNFRSPHTHCYSPPIDTCWNQEGDCWNGAVICQQGTIMSYCHQCTGGISNIDLTFGPVASNWILGGLQSCIGLARDPCFVDAGFGGSEQGTQSNPYRTIAKGTWFVAPGGTVSIDAGNYPENLLICQPMTLSASGGTVLIGD